MKKLLLLPFIILLGFCSNRSNDGSGNMVNVLNKKEMIAVLTDIHLAEASLRVGKIQRISAADSNYQKSLYLTIFEKHDITPGEFRASLRYYTKRISELDEIYAEVITGLAEQEAQLQAQDSTSQKTADSAINIKSNPESRTKKPS